MTTGVGARGSATSSVARPAARLRPLLEAAGARWIEVPVLHPADPFLETAGEDIRRRMFVTEGPSGERLALRPDFTIPVCLAHLAAGGGPKRYAYEGVVFRRHDAGSPERLETGYEDIGRDDRAEADAEALRLALAGVAAVAAGRLTVRIGDIGLFVALLAALGLPGRWRRRLRRSFGSPALIAADLTRLVAAAEGADARLDDEALAAARSGGSALTALVEKRAAAQGRIARAGRSPAEIAERFLDQRAVPDPRLAARAAEAVRAFLGIEGDLRQAAAKVEAFASERGFDFGASLANFARRTAAMTPLVADARFEAGFGRPLDYYTGLVFEIRAGAWPHAIAGGGRYDRLMQMLGAAEPIPAVGFTIRLDAPEGQAV